MKLNKIITVLLLSGACFMGQHTADAEAAEAETVISNQFTAVEDSNGEDLNEGTVVSMASITSQSGVMKKSSQTVNVNVVEPTQTPTIVSTQAPAPANTVAPVATVTPVATQEPVLAVEAPVETVVKEKKKKTKVVVQSTKSTKKNASSKKSYTASDLKLMSCIIYCEASGEPYAGKLAVGIVVMNRKSSKSFPNTIKGVIYQKYQFGPVRNGSLNRALKRYESGKFNSATEKSCIKAAKSALSGNKKVNYRSKSHDMRSFYFFSTYISRPRLVIKNHQFK